jgi:glycosyltransferase involved in cell wall biosynthesis
LQKRIVFISTMSGAAWGGSEELWSQTAMELKAQGFLVHASIGRRLPVHSRIDNMVEAGIEMWFRPEPYPVWKQVRRALTGKTPITLEAQRLFAARRPSFVIISEGSGLPSIDLLELCVKKQLPFVLIQHANVEWLWATDDLAKRYRVTLAAAQKCYFVSKSNQQLTEKQIGCELPNAEVVRNPFAVDFNASPAWPRLGPEDELRFACVARLDPTAKGQDILLEALAKPSWTARAWRLSLYGDGPMRDSLDRLSRRLGLFDRVSLAGHVTVEEIWASNHVLVMPSRYEGLPLAMVEAMLCGRPVIATDVAGHSEVIEDGVTGFLADAPTVSSMANALERFWVRRSEARGIGAAASKSIRQLVPPDPVRVFAEKIKEEYRSATRHHS